MRPFGFFFFAFLGFTLLAQKPSIRYECQMLHDAAGEKIKTGEYGLVGVSIYLDTMLVLHSEPNYKVAQSGEGRDAEDGSFMDCILQMSVGDSLMFSIPIDEKAAENPKFKGHISVNFHIKLYEKLSAETYIGQMPKSSFSEKINIASEWTHFLQTQKSYFEARNAVISDSLKVLSARFNEKKRSDIIILKEGNGGTVQTEPTGKLLVYLCYVANSSGEILNNKFPIIYPEYQRLVCSDDWMCKLNGLKEGTVAAIYLTKEDAQSFRSNRLDEGLNQLVLLYIEIIKIID